MPASRPTVDRFNEKHAPDPSTGCWVWIGAKARGYGYIRRQRDRNVRAHRFSYEEFVGPVPDGMLVLHKCHNPLCVNPEHLRLGTHQDNMDDLRSAGRSVGRPRGTPKAVRPYRFTTPEQRAGIIEALKRGEKVLRIAKQFGVDRKTVRNLRPQAP